MWLVDAGLNSRFMLRCDNFVCTFFSLHSAQLNGANIGEWRGRKYLQM